MQEDRNISLKIGEVYMMEFAGEGSSQKGWRPGVVFQNNTGNIYSPNIIALPLTSHLKKANQPTHVIINGSEEGLPRTSMVLCENPECMPKCRIGEYITTLSNDVMCQIAEAHLIAIGSATFINISQFASICEKVSKLNQISLS